MTQPQGPLGPVEITEVLAYDDGAAAAVADVDGDLQARLGAGALDESDRLHLRHRGLQGARLWLAREQTGSPEPTGTGQPTRPLAFALLREHDDDAELALAVAGVAAKHGVGSALAGAVAREHAGRRLRAWSHSDHPGAARLAERHGLRRARELLVMQRPASDLPPLPEHPGIEIGAYTDADRDDLLATNAAAFAHHPEQGAMDAANLAERMAQDWYSPAGLLVARDSETGAFLGFHWTKTARRPGDAHEPGEEVDADADGEVYVVGVAPDAQGRGLGRLLTLAGLHHLAGWGVRTIELYVEGDNHPARAVYERLGFRVGQTHVQYAGVVTP